MHCPKLQEDQLKIVACALGQLLQRGDLLVLDGAMGTGKTTFTRALAHGLGVDEPANVCSPSFALAMIHPGPVPLHHIDLFRLQDCVAENLNEGDPAQEFQPASFEALGLEYDALLLSRYVTVIEWAKYWPALPTQHLAIQFVRPTGVTHFRTITASATGHRYASLLTDWANSLKNLQVEVKEDSPG